MKSRLGAFVLIALAAAAYADEGMWLFNQPPRGILQKRYGYELTDAWLEHLQRASVRFNSGGSGSFVGRDGLVLTNHHIGVDALHKLSEQGRDYVREGYCARTPREELRCLDLELNVLESVEDVTARVNQAVPQGADAAKAFEARRQVIAQIEKESLEATGLRSNVITMWQGGAYHLYRFKRYTDVRLVFAPETQIGAFGGDPDNFEFPRQALDICFFRVYENGRPARVKNFLRFAPEGGREGDLVFVSGHSGRTERLYTAAEIRVMRDYSLPFWLRLMKYRRFLLTAWSSRGEESARRAQVELFQVQNSYKALEGRLAGLLDPAILTAKARAEADFRARLAQHPEHAGALAAYERIAAATQTLGELSARRILLEDGLAFWSESFGIARTLLRAGQELPKPNGERLEEFADSEKASLELDLFSPKPIYADLETYKLADSLIFLSNALGSEDPTVWQILAGNLPRARAAELVQGTKVRDVSFRRQLYEGGAKAVAAARDPMIELARAVDREARALRKIEEEQTEVLKEAHAAIDRARNAVLGTAGYPDATFTLRLSFGVVKGLEENGKTLPPRTTFGSLLAKSAEKGGRPPFDLPLLWKERGPLLNPDTPLNFASTCDITGGNSGSPVVDRSGGLVGVIFDGNRGTLSWDVAYSDKLGRAIAVHAAAILEALEKVYDMPGLVRELRDGGLPGRAAEASASPLRSDNQPVR